MTERICQIQCSRNGINDIDDVRVVGLDLVANHLLGCRSSMDADALKAWVYELEHRDFGVPARLTAGFRQVDLSKPPVAVFHLAGTPLRIDTLIDFRTGVVLVTHISEVPRRLRSANT